LTGVLAFILIYLFSIVGFLFFRDDFLIEVDALNAVGVNKGTCITICNILVIDRTYMSAKCLMFIVLFQDARCGYSVHCVSEKRDT